VDEIVAAYLSRREPTTEKVASSRAMSRPEQNAPPIAIAGPREDASPPPPRAPDPTPPRPAPRPVDFVCEQDVRAAITARTHIYVHSRTIITPAARDLGDSHSVFTRV